VAAAAWQGGTGGPAWPGAEEGRGSNPSAFPQMGERRLVSHFQYLSWPDYGVPSSAATLIDFLGAVKQQQRVAVSALGPRFKGHPGGPPIVVHCSAGIGRTGNGVTLLLGRRPGGGKPWTWGAFASWGAVSRSDL